MSQQAFRRWLLPNEELPWIRRRPFWQYALLDWAAWLLTGLVVSAVVTAILGHFPLSWFIGWAGAGTVVRPVLARRRWRRIQARLRSASASTQD